MKMYAIPKSPIIKGSIFVLFMFLCLHVLTPRSRTMDEVPPTTDIIKEITGCSDRPMVPKVEQRGNYWVLYNYIMAEKKFRCHESITYTTHADYSFIDNLVPLVERWQGPVSVALYAPGTDFKRTIKSIAYLRDCSRSLVREYVTFHVYFKTGHVPKVVPPADQVFTEPYNCSVSPPYFNMNTTKMYKNRKNLLYPVNVGRNVAREMAQTHYVLASDVELYPSLGLIPQFLGMIAANDDPFLNKEPKVFALHVFEVSEDQQVPDTKTQLKEMLVNGTAIPFHKDLCTACHRVPNATQWQCANETNQLNVFSVGKRTGKFKNWEPFYIGTHAEPLFDERLTWEGKSNKMTQAYLLCVLDYNFLMLNNAFLVHRPGIKVWHQDPTRYKESYNTYWLIQQTILPELNGLYGTRENCTV